MKTCSKDKCFLHTISEDVFDFEKKTLYIVNERYSIDE